MLMILEEEAEELMERRGRSIQSETKKPVDDPKDWNSMQK